MNLLAAYDITDDGVVIRLRGEIDLAVADRFRTHMRSGLDAAAIHPRRLLVVDLTAAPLLSSLALSHLSTCQAEANDAGTTLRIVCRNPTTSRLLQLTRLDKIISLYSSFDEAVRSAHRIRPHGRHA